MLYSFPPQQPTRIDPYNVPTFNYHNYHIYTQLCICVKVAYFAYIFHFHFHFNMALYLSNIFGCFSESSSPQSKRYECNGDVCVLRNPKENINKKASNTNNKQKQFSRFSIKWSPRSRFWIARLMILLQTGWLVLLIHQCNSLCSIYILFFFFFLERIYCIFCCYYELACICIWGIGLWSLSELLEATKSGILFIFLLIN